MSEHQSASQERAENIAWEAEEKRNSLPSGYMPRGWRIVSVMIALLMMGFSGLAMGMAVSKLRWWHDYWRDYREVQATVSKTIVPNLGIPAERRRGQTKTIIKYSYTVDGRTYTHYATIRGLDRRSNLKDYWPEEYNDLYEDGQITTAYVRVDDPAEAALLRGAGLPIYASYGFLCIPAKFFFLLGILLLVVLTFRLSPFIDPPSDGTRLYQRWAAPVFALFWYVPLPLIGLYTRLVMDVPIPTVILVYMGIDIWIGLIPLGIAIPDRGVASRLRHALICTPIFSLFGAGLTLAVVGFITSFFTEPSLMLYAGSVLVGGALSAVITTAAALCGRLRWKRRGPELVRDQG